MSINGQGYKPTFLRCVEEGYDAAKDHMKGILEELVCPYHAEDERYEHDAWESGQWWYLARVH